MKELRTLLNKIVRRDLPEEPVALLFSGGTDSLTVLWTLLDLGAKVTCYTFHLSYFESNDARVSRRACEFWKVPQVFVHEDSRPIPEQLKDIIRVVQSPRKTHVEVMYGYWFLMQAVKEQHIYSGIQADTLYGSNRNSAIQYGKKTAQDFADFRRRLLMNPDQEGLSQAHKVAAHFAKVFHAPYSDKAVQEFFFRYSWKDLNSPRQKMPAVISFVTEFKACPVYRHDDNMQCGSHIREHLGTFVKDYRTIYKEVQHAV